MSASSNCVTCGIITQLRARLAPEIFLIRDSGVGLDRRRTSRSPASATAAGSSAPAPPALLPAPAHRARACERALHERLDVLLEDAALRPAARDAREVDAELARELAHRRRRVRACRRSGRVSDRLRRRQRRRRASVRANVRRARSGCSEARACRRSRSAASRDRVLAGCDGGVARLAGSAPVCAVFSDSSGVPSLTRSPTVTRTPSTMPPTGDGTSIVALSDSSVTSAIVRLDDVARLDEHLDHRHVREIADVAERALRSSGPRAASSSRLHPACRRVPFRRAAKASRCSAVRAPMWSRRRDSRRRRGSGRGAPCARLAFERQHHAAFAHLVAGLDAPLPSPCPRQATARPSSPCRIRA